MMFSTFKYRSLFQRYSSFKDMQIGQLMMSYTRPNFDQPGYLSQFASELFDSLQCDSLL